MNPTIIVTVIGAMVVSAARVVVRRGPDEIAKACGSALMAFPWDGVKSVIGFTNSDDLDETTRALPEVKEHADAIVKAFAEAGFKASLEIRLDPQPTEVNQ